MADVARDQCYCGWCHGPVAGLIDFDHRCLIGGVNQILSICNAVELHENFDAVDAIREIAAICMARLPG